MVKEIQIGDKKVAFRSSGALPIIYRELTGHEFFQDIQAAENGSVRMLDIAWAMYRHGNPEDKIDEVSFLEQFEFDDITDALTDILGILTDDMEEQSDAKKKEE